MERRQTPRPDSTFQRLLDKAHEHARYLECQHPFILPNGDCIGCGKFVTSAPGLQTNHIVIKRAK